MEEEKSDEISQSSSVSKEKSGFSFGKLLVIILGVGLLLGVVYFLFFGDNNQDNFVEVPGVEDSTDEEREDVPLVYFYPMEEVALHSTADDCWMVIDGNIYDASPFIADAAHPGRDAILQGCGIDATDLFNTRPMGSGTSHSSNARALLKGFLIGELSDEYDEMESQDNSESGDDSSMLQEEPGL